MARQRYIHPPEGGWQPHTLYLVSVKMHHYNPAWRGIMYSGFLDERGHPSGYSTIWSSGSACSIPFFEPLYVRVIRTLTERDELNYTESDQELSREAGE